MSHAANLSRNFYDNLLLFIILIIQGYSNTMVTCNELRTLFLLGCDVLIKSLAVLKNDFSLLPTLTIVGEGPERDKLGAIVTDCGLVAQVSFTGKKSGIDLVKIINAHKIMVVPSIWNEPFGIVALEGLACGCKVVVPDAGGLPEAIGLVGKKFEKGSCNSLAQIIRDELIRPSTTLQSQIDEHLSKFTLTATLDKLLSIFKTQ